MDTQHRDEADKSKSESPENPTKTDTATDTESPREIGGRGGLDPTRYGDWEKNGRCIDF